VPRWRDSSTEATGREGVSGGKKAGGNLINGTGAGAGRRIAGFAGEKNFRAGQRGV
jgi:hypothetical protein